MVPCRSRPPSGTCADGPPFAKRPRRQRQPAHLLLLLMLTLLETPVWAGGATDQASPSKSISLEVIERSSDAPIIPAKTAIVGKVLLDIVLDPGRKYDLPVTLLSAIPIYDNNGSVVIPTGSIITAVIQKREGGDYITVDSIVYRGLNIEIPTQGRLMPAQIRPENYGQYIEQPKSKLSNALTASQDSVLLPTLLGIAVANSYQYDKYGYKTEQQNLTPLILGIAGIDLGIKLLAVLFDNPPKTLPPLVEIPQDSLIVFTTGEDIALPQSNSPATPMNE